MFIVSGGAPPPVLFDATIGQQTQNAPTSQTLTLGAAAKALVVFWGLTTTSSSSAAANLGITCGGTPLTLLGSVYKFHQFSSFCASTYYGSFYVFGLLNPPVGAQTIAYSNSGSGTNYTTVQAMSFLNATGFGTVQSGTTTTSGANNQAVTAPEGSMVAQGVNNSAAVSSGNFTNYSQNEVANYGPGQFAQAADYGYGPGPNPNFGFTMPSSWNAAELAVPVLSA